VPKKDRDGTLTRFRKFVERPEVVEIDPDLGKVVKDRLFRSTCQPRARLPLRGLFVLPSPSLSIRQNPSLGAVSLELFFSHPSLRGRDKRGGHSSIIHDRLSARLENARFCAAA
jgi:hypothetical protein